LGLDNTVSKKLSHFLPVDFGLTEVFNHPRDFLVLFEPVFHCGTLLHATPYFVLEKLKSAVCFGEFLQ